MPATSRLIYRERARRRATLAAAAALLALALVPMLGHLIPPDAHLAGRSHLVALCLVALRAVFGPVDWLFPTLLIAGLCYAVVDRMCAAFLARRALAPLPSCQPPEGDPLWRAARTARLDPAQVRLVEHLPSAAFTAGWLRPVVYIAPDTVASLSTEQLAAVLAHEAAHVRRRDPLRLSLLRFVSCMLFWLPAFRRLAADLSDETEIMADDAAVGHVPAIALAAAIVRIASCDLAGRTPAAAVGFHGPALTDRRVRRLLGQEPAPTTHLTLRSAVAAAFALAIVLSSAVIPAASNAGTTSRAPMHCQDHDVSIFQHLFCAFERQARSPDDCPHGTH